MSVCVCVCVAVAGLLEERSTFVFDFRVRSARFDVQECSSKGMTENATGCPAHVCDICVAKQGEHNAQHQSNKLISAALSFQLIS